MTRTIVTIIRGNIPYNYFSIEHPSTYGWEHPEGYGASANAGFQATYDPRTNQYFMDACCPFSTEHGERHCAETFLDSYLGYSK